MTFPGFPDEITTQIRIPEQFFHQVLLATNNLDELKLTLYIFWRLDRMEGLFRYIRFTDLLKEKHLVDSISKDPDKARSVLQAALNRTIKHGILLQADISTDEGQEKLICLNSPRGRAVVGAIQRDEWRGREKWDQSLEIYSEHPNIYKLYEAN